MIVIKAPVFCGNELLTFSCVPDLGAVGVDRVMMPKGLPYLPESMGVEHRTYDPVTHDTIYQLHNLGSFTPTAKDTLIKAFKGSGWNCSIKGDLTG